MRVYKYYTNNNEPKSKATYKKKIIRRMKMMKINFLEI